MPRTIHDHHPMARARSLWAWGWADKLPDDAARAGLVQLARALMPAAQPALRALPPDEPGVPAPRVAIPDELVEFSGQDPRDRAIHTRGRAFPDLVAGFAGDFAGAPDL